MTWARSDGTELPDWWEVDGGEKGRFNDHAESRIQQSSGDSRFIPGEQDFVSGCSIAQSYITGREKQ